tara:strand:+ start:1549 stop:1719 length:171 start_codon:yes stop_codon:yes gene_type:complete
MNLSIEQETWRLADVHCNGTHPAEGSMWFDDLSEVTLFKIMCNFVINKYKPERREL